jgi:hypothetical protein
LEGLQIRVGATEIPEADRGVADRGELLERQAAL